MSQNKFLTELLTLQQDGQAAISGPINWNTKPLLEVRTGLHSDVDRLSNSMFDNSESVGSWHFFVGSPGNGKSAGAGMLVRRLLEGGHAVFETENKIPIDELDQSRVPYCLEVRRHNEKFPYLFIAQDASVLPNPFDTNADPARALLQLLIESARRGVSLVVCTNRGVIERAFAQANSDAESRNAVWFNALRVAVGAITEGVVDFSKTARKPVFPSVRVTATSLDRRSLILNSDTFDRLIDNALAPEKWSACEGCSAKSLCPFSSNKDWLLDNKLRNHTLRVIRHAELIEGQIIVLREALALISLILAGCPHDYNTPSPCDWVREKVEKGDIFSLASRRIYMLMFSAYSPMGLADDPRDLRVQKNDIESIYTSVTSDRTRFAVDAAINKKNWPSTDVGAPRLLGQGGIFSELDVFAGVHGAAFSDRWSESWNAIEQEPVWASGIERALVECWVDLQRAAAGSKQQSPSIYKSLSRWITAYSMRIGSLVEGVTTFGEDLDALVEILQIEGQPSAAQEMLLTGIEATLESSLTEGNKGLMLTPTTTLHGRWATQALKPHFATAEPGSLTASLMFGTTNKGKTVVPLNTRAFIWLKRRAERHMDSSTFPKEYLETARDAMLRVATLSSYDTKDDVTLRIEVGLGRRIEIRRSYRGVYIEYM